MAHRPRLRNVVGSKLPKRQDREERLSKDQIRTSKTHPLQIASIEITPASGRIGVTFAPGKHDPHSPGGAGARDLAADLDAIVAWGASTLVTLIEPHEFELLRIPRLGEEARQRGLDWRHLPIRDMSVPDRAFEAIWPAQGALLRARLTAGESPVIHCRGGLGRAGMIAARLLVETGDGPDDAMKKVRKVRPSAIETKAQERWVGHGRRSS